MLDQVRGIVAARIGVGQMVVNDYVLEIAPSEDGYTLTVRRGSETQSIDLRGLAAEELARIRDLLAEQPSLRQEIDEMQKTLEQMEDPRVIDGGNAAGL